MNWEGVTLPLSPPTHSHYLLRLFDTQVAFHASICSHAILLAWVYR